MQEENWQNEIKGIVKQGPVKIKTGFGVWKKRWLVFQRATSYGPSRLVVCSKRESFIKHPFGKKTHTVVFMRDVNNVSKGVTKHGETKVAIGFNIAKPYMEFICLEAQEDYWVECLGLGKGKDDNLDDDSFRAYLLPACSLNYSGECVLQIRKKFITLFSDEMKRQTIVKWPLEVIRRFSKDHTNKIFFLETGRLSSTGECLYNIRSYWFEEMFKKIVQAQAGKFDAEPIVSFTANDFDYDKSPSRKSCDPKDDSEDDDYLHPIPSLSAVRDSTCKLDLEKIEESPYLSMISSRAKETKSNNDGADQTSQTDSHLSQGYVGYRDPEVFCSRNPPPAPHNLNRQSQQLNDTNEIVPVYPDNQKDELIQGNATENKGEDEMPYLEHDPLPIPQLPQRRSFKIPDDVPSSFTQPLRGGENASVESDDDDYLTPIADLAKISLTRINSSKSVPSSHVNPTVGGSSFA
ncbi:hypothetical protein CHS0354_013521 [Potamilus streckersoni]|uniref:IRS-type PTB domain-containing protein n=1 Tax=Potamilus streckersoni TaxID=2493646 RepID=A0AAE0T9L4_9BIVA|nr:hypothetical protein CHS0354_013521 [Potamilus streckersoni]